MLTKHEKELNAFAETVLMGITIPTNEMSKEDIIYIITQAFNTMLYNRETPKDIVTRAEEAYNLAENKYTKKARQITHLSLSVHHGMTMLALGVEKRFHKCSGNFYYSQCYVYNLDMVDFSEFGDCFYKKTGNAYKRVN